jgi:hypothetical protein
MSMHKKIFLFLSFAHFGLFAQEISHSWVAPVGSNSSNIQAYFIDADSEGSAISVGTFQNEVDFDPGDGVYNLLTGETIAYYIQKLDVNGNFLWAYDFPIDIAVKAITSDAENNIYLTGDYEGIVDFDWSEDGEALEMATSSLDLFVLKLNSDGEFEDVWTFGGLNDQLGRDIAVNEEGDIAVCGGFKHMLELGGTSLMNFGSGFDIFVLQLNSDGAVQWAYSFGDSPHDFGESIEYDHEGNLLISGYFSETVDFDPGPAVTNESSTGAEDAFLLKLSSTGTYIWSRSFGNADLDIAKRLKVDEDNNIILTGDFAGTVDFDPGEDTYELTAESEVVSVFITKFDDSGEFLWARTIGENETNCFGLDVGEDNNIYLSGFFRYDLDLDPGDGVVSYTSEGSYDVFYLALTADGDHNWSTVIGNDKPAYCRALTYHDNKLYTAGSFMTAVDFDWSDEGEDIHDYGLTLDAFVHQMQISPSSASLVENDETTVKVFPNPFQNKIIIQLPSNEDAANITVHNLSGQVITQLSTNQNTATLDLDVTPGTYIVTVKTANSKQNFKLIK